MFCLFSYIIVNLNPIYHYSQNIHGTGKGKTLRVHWTKLSFLCVLCHIKLKNRFLVLPNSLDPLKIM